jgi:hypothetical protein
LKLPESRESSSEVRVIGQHREASLGVISVYNPTVAGTGIIRYGVNRYVVFDGFFIELPIFRR